MTCSAWGRIVQAEMRRVGGVLLRANKHQVYRLPDGRRVNVACSPGDRRAIFNLQRDIRRGAIPVSC
jgi:hypothetical protein